MGWGEHIFQMNSGEHIFWIDHGEHIIGMNDGENISPMNSNDYILPMNTRPAIQPKNASFFHDTIKRIIASIISTTFLHKRSAPMHTNYCNYCLQH